jgi:opacity protein-like surface antigen
MFCFGFALHRGVLAEMSRIARYLLIGALHFGALMLAASAVRAAADDIFGIKTPAIPFTGLGGLTGPAYEWNGFYAGGHMGAAWGQSNWSGGLGVSGTTNLFAPIDTFDEGGSWFVGLQGGYNYVLPNRILIGAEVDASFPSFQTLSGISIGGISNFTSPTLGAVTYSETVLSSGTARGRIGYAPGSWLFYATGGFAWTYNQQSLTQLSTGNAETPFLWRLGWTAGAGVEVPIGPHWTAAARISIHRLRHKQQDVLRNAAIQFRLPAPGAALWLELPVRQRCRSGYCADRHQGGGRARRGLPQPARSKYVHIPRLPRVPLALSGPPKSPGRR